MPVPAPGIGMMECKACGASNADDARFCNQCGQALTAAEPVRAYTPRHLADSVLRRRDSMAGERKLVTVLFADMVGSTGLAEQVDPEVWHGVLDEYFGILTEAVHAHGGTVNQYTGDGVMALFGAPVAYEDHAQRACHAALQAQNMLGAFADRLRLEQGLNLSMRMGLNSGEVIVGTIGDGLRNDYTAQGLTVNVAARMEQIAAPGSAYLTRRVADLVEGYFHLRALGASRVKGVDEPVEVFELIEPSAVTLRLDLARQRGLTTFIGREAEMRRLNELRASAAAGQGSVVLISGDGGLGKSRLCLEVRERWEAAGVTVFTTSGLPSAQATPLWPVQQLIRQRFGVAADEPPAVARQKLAGALLMDSPEMAEHLPMLFEFMEIADPAQPATELTPDVRRRRLLDLYSRTCPTRCPEPVVLLVEDLHWMDAASLEFFGQMSRAIADSRVLLIFNSRPMAWPRWLLDAHPVRIEMQPLAEDAVRRMAGELLGEDGRCQALARRVAARAAGNPFFVEETVRALAAQGSLEGTPGAYRPTEAVDAIPIPETVHNLVAGRIDHLDEADKLTLQYAAVLGGLFEERLLRECAHDIDDLDDSIARLRSLHYLDVVTEQPGHLKFGHPLYQEIAYTTQLRTTRRQRHEQVAQVLEQRVDGRDDVSEFAVALAHHWDEAGNALASARWHQAAGIWMARTSLEDELDHFRRAIAALESAPEDATAIRLGISARASILRVATFTPLPDAELQAYYDEAKTLAERLGDDIALAELMVSNGLRVLNLAHADAAVANVRDAMALARRLGDRSLEVRFRIPILFSFMAAGRIRDGLAVLDETDGGEWHRTALADDNFMSRGFRAWLLAMTGDVQRGLDEAQASIEFARVHGFPVSWMHANLVDIKVMAGERQGLLESAATALNQARSFGSPLFDAVAHRAQGQALVESGDPATAYEYLIGTLDVVRPGAPGHQFMGPHCLVLGQACAALRRPDEAMDWLERGMAVARAGHQRLWQLRLLLELVALRRRGPELEAELAEIDTLIDVTGAEHYRSRVRELRAEAPEPVRLS